MVTSLTSNTIDQLETQLENNIIELKEEIYKIANRYGMNSTRTIGKSKKLDKYIYELQVLKQLKRDL